MLEICSAAEPKSVVGYISEEMVKKTTPDFTKYIINVNDINDKISKNLNLMCGDGNLELMAPAIIDEAGRMPFPGHADPWKWVHEVFVRLRKCLDDEWTVFIDTNPSFSIYTEMAICGATKLLVPVNADDSSRVAAKALFALLYGTVPPHPFFGNYTFAAKAKDRSLDIPRVHLAIGNRFTQFKGAAAAFAAFSDATADQLFAEFSRNPERFTERDPIPKTKEEFLRGYVKELRDFNTAGVVAAHIGTPLSKMKQDYYPVHNDPDVKVNKSQIDAGLRAIDAIVRELS